MYKVTKVIDFCYGHRLLNYEGKCRYLHGHNGRVEIDIVANSLDERGFVIDFTEVKDRMKEWIDETIDHKMLLCKDDPMLPILQQRGEPVVVLEVNPTAENIAKEIFNYARKIGLNVSEVRLWETPSSFATYREVEFPLRGG